MYLQFEHHYDGKKLLHRYEVRMHSDGSYTFDTLDSDWHESELQSYPTQNEAIKSLVAWEQQNTEADERIFAHGRDAIVLSQAGIDGLSVFATAMEPQGLIDIEKAQTIVLEDPDIVYLQIA